MVGVPEIGTAIRRCITDTDSHSLEAAGIELPGRHHCAMPANGGSRCSVPSEGRRAAAAKLREALGAYALAEPILPSAMVPSLEAAGTHRETFIPMGNGDFADSACQSPYRRRADWPEWFGSAADQPIPSTHSAP